MNRNHLYTKVSIEKRVALIIFLTQTLFLLLILNIIKHTIIITYKVHGSLRIIERSWNSRQIKAAFHVGRLVQGLSGGLTIIKRRHKDDL